MKKSRFAATLHEREEEAVTVPAVSEGAAVETQFFSEAEVIKILGVTSQWLRDHTTRVLPIIPFVPMGRHKRFPRALFYEWMNSRVETRPSWERKENK